MHARSRQQGFPSQGYYVQTLHNHQNVQYFAEFSIGGQEVAGIFDTGSSQLLVRSTDCASCAHPTPPYDNKKSSTYVNNGTIAAHHYGSGSTKSLKGYDNVQVGPLVANHQAFWQIVDHRMPVLNVAKFAAIVGIGPDGAFGNEDSTLLMGFNVTEFSVCLKKPGLSDGYLTWGPTVMPQYKEWYYAKARVTGQHHWATKMTNLVSSQLKKTGSHLESIPCSGAGCVAIIDSGTSLIAAPGWALMQLSMMIPPIKEDCSNLHELPNLQFELDGVHFSLPPRSYVMRVKGAVMQSDSVWDILFFKPKIRKVDICMPAFMQLNMMSKQGPIFILGMPFFRYYHTTFDRKSKMMHFAKAGPDCFPHPFYENGADAFVQEDKEDEDPYQPTDVDLASIVPPTFSGLMADIPDGGNIEI